MRWRFFVLIAITVVINLSVIKFLSSSTGLFLGFSLYNQNDVFNTSTTIADQNTTHQKPRVDWREESNCYNYTNTNITCVRAHLRHISCWFSNSAVSVNDSMLFLGNNSGVEARTKEEAEKINSRVPLSPEYHSLLPFQEIPKLTYRTCAVVGNSGIVKNSGFGAEIDYHEAVFRVNCPPTERYSYDVGNKTTFSTIGCENRALECRQHLNCTSLYGRNTTLFTNVFRQDNKSMACLREIQTSLDQIGHSRAYPYSVDVMWLAQELFQLKGKRFSSGAICVLFALRLCEQVDLYGFYPFSLNGQGVVPYSYWRSPKLKQFPAHNMWQEFALYYQWSFYSHGTFTIQYHLPEITQYIHMRLSNLTKSASPSSSPSPSPTSAVPSSLFNVP